MAFPTPHTRAELLDLLSRTTDSTWLGSMLAAPDSAALIEAMLAIGVQVSQSVYDGLLNTMPQFASGGSAGTLTGAFRRIGSIAGFTVPAGYRFRNADGTSLYVTTEQVYPFGTNDFTLPLATVRKTDAVNTFVDPLALAGENAETIVPIGSPVILDGGLIPVFGPPGTGNGSSIQSLTQISDAESDWLTAIGNERGQKRQTNESTDAYRRRVRNVIDVVAPAAISTAVNGVASEFGMTPVVLSEALSSGEDAPTLAAYNMAVLPSIFFGPTVAGSATEFSDDLLGVMYSAREARSYFELSVPATPTMPVGLQGLFFSSGDSYDYFDDPLWGFECTGVESVGGSLMAIWEEANRKRAAGVQFDVLCNPWIIVSGVDAKPNPPGASPHVILTPPAGTGWHLVDVELSAIADIPALGTPSYGLVTITYADASVDSYNLRTWLDTSTTLTSARIALDLGLPMTLAAYPPFITKLSHAGIPIVSIDVTALYIPAGLTTTLFAAARVIPCAL